MKEKRLADLKLIGSETNFANTAKFHMMFKWKQEKFWAFL